MSFVSHGLSTWWPVLLSKDMIVNKREAGMRQQVCVVVGSALRSEWLWARGAGAELWVLWAGPSVCSSLVLLRVYSHNVHVHEFTCVLLVIVGM